MVTATFKQALKSFVSQLVMTSCFLFLIHSVDAEWKLSYILTPEKEFSSFRLFYKNPSSFEWTSSQITATPSGIRFVLNLLLCPLQKEGDVQINATLDDGAKETLKGHIFTGGEKILIDETSTDWLIFNLNQGQSIQLEIESYKTKINSLNFPPLWAKAKHLLVNDKIHLQLK